MRRAWIETAILLLAAIPGIAAGPRSNVAAVSLVARVAPLVSLQADNPTTTGATASVISTGQNTFLVQFTPNGDEAALIEVPVILRTNTNDVLVKASANSAVSGYIRMDGGQAIASSVSTRPMPLGSNVTFAVASGLLRTAAVDTPLAGMIVIAIPPGAVPNGTLASVQITLEPLRQ